MQYEVLSLDAPRETTNAHVDMRFRHVAHLFHLEWHGIRSATSCLPGHKIGITADRNLDGDTLRRLIGFIYENNIKHVICQGYSLNADLAIRAMNANFKSNINLHVISHLTSTQFENYFEVEMQKYILKALQDKIVRKIASVKPNFNSVISQYWPKLIINCTPALRGMYRHSSADPGYAFVPLENTIRKNLYTNILAALDTDMISEVLTVNDPSGLGNIRDLQKCRTIGFQRGRQLLERMADASVVMNCTLAECQPMTQLEALAVGTPCMTGRLGIEELNDHPLTKMTEVEIVDNPAHITKQVEALITTRRGDPENFDALLKGYVEFRNGLAIDRLADFVGI
ncbi:hypothetical protein [Methylorubrum sp. GM97]|uniref:hypothetical protein n=1 Tax=Methylorubrum sp. GM97 TaxID=2938232 RepID=UPI0021870508|nr:hypothetical protein [Methylorubrum sp. GM97]BDL41099.1 hypothetical protein MSPGM_36890 [Methylorubrum sp. GM97]